MYPHKSSNSSSASTATTISTSTRATRKPACGSSSSTPSSRPSASSRFPFVSYAGIIVYMETQSQYTVNSITDAVSAEGFTERVDLYRVDACCKLDSEQRSRMGQFFTSSLVARFMASLFEDPGQEIRLLDAGAGVGTLTAAFVEETFRRATPPCSISVKAYELEPLLVEYLHSTLVECQEVCQGHGVGFDAEVLEEDFIRAGVDMLRGGLFPVERHSFNRAILNPPYKKIRSDSQHRRLPPSLRLPLTYWNPVVSWLPLRLAVSVMVHTSSPSGRSF